MRAGRALFTPVVFSAVAVFLWLGVGCGVDREDDAPTLSVFATSSLEPVLRPWERDLEERLDVDVTFSFAASPVVARQVVEGAPADVLITADRTSMEIAAAPGAVRARTIVARNRLMLVVAPNNPLEIESVHDLSRDDLELVLCDPDVPCGRLAEALLAEMGVTVSPSSLEENVAAAVGKITLGEADATIAYRSDVRARPDTLEGIEIPEADEAEFEAVYPAAVVAGSDQSATAAELIELLASREGTGVFTRAGFLGPKRPA